MNIGTLKSYVKKAVLVGFFFFIPLTATLSLSPREAVAKCTCCTDCDCVNTAHAALRARVLAEHQATRAWFGTSGILCDYCGTSLLGAHEAWLIDHLFRLRILPAMMKMTEQLSAVMVQQMLILGTFFDAKQQLEVQRLIQQKEAEALTDYRPDEQICHIGTMVKSLAATERRGDITAFALNARSISRQLGNANLTSAETPGGDKKSRLEQFKKVFCDKRDNNHINGKPATGLGILCPGPLNPADRLNADIDFTRTMELPLTLDLDFGDNPNDLTDTEETVMSMADYLYAHDIFTRPTSGVLEIKKNQDEYLDLRSVVAKRSVAENSFNAIAALKTKGRKTGNGANSGWGSDDTIKHMSVLLSDTGMDQNDIDKFYGTNPSYLAQMEVLAKTIYQRPQFYAGLYNTPANLARKRAAMEAIGAMLERDIFESRLRSENILSILLELDIIKYQEGVESVLKDSIKIK